ncbi:ParB N-terminal domain-containing protein [Ammoniphilus sp. 3BR4]|uniref:ParB N-terminal domain-containing protein n=1 Tax=Ammoniphilus sp. 3BR4 TaxID=3158265 RepID=UPI00346663EA
MINLFSSLEMIHPEQICLHEEHEGARLDTTCSAIREEGVLRHPPLAMPIRDGRYLILDGAHRTCALQKLGCYRIPVQVVKGEDLRLEAWDHVVPEGSWLHELRNYPSLHWTPTPNQARPVAVVRQANGERYFVYYQSSSVYHFHNLDMWHQMVRSYSKQYAVKRLPHSNDFRLEPGLVRLSYPAYTVQQLEETVLAGKVMPAGVTRFMVNGRLLNLQIPLKLLLESQFVQEEWNQYREQWADSLRLYSEPVYLCEV